MRARFQNLRIDAYSSRFSVNSNSNRSSSCLTHIKPEMCNEEKRIHSFFDSEGIFQQEIKEALLEKSLSGFESPKLASEFRRRSSLYIPNNRSCSKTSPTEDEMDD